MVTSHDDFSSFFYFGILSSVFFLSLTSYVFSGTFERKKKQNKKQERTNECRPNQNLEP